MSEVYYGEGILLENNAIEGNAVTTAFASEEGGNYIPDKEYINAGLEWNDDIHAWFYNGKFVADLYDNGGIYTCDTKSDNDVTYIEVIRNKRGAIENINEISKEKLQELILGN